MECTHDDGTTRLFCADCGKVKNRRDLESVRLPGFIGVHHSTSPKIEAFFSGPDAGNAEIFERGYRPPAG
jgi:hypothetical protein